MAETIKCILEVYDAATYSLFTPVHIKGGTVGDTVTYTVDCSAVGSFTDDIVISIAGYPTGAGVTYDPVDATIGPGESCVISIDTTGCDDGVYTMTVSAELA